MAIGKECTLRNPKVLVYTELQLGVELPTRPGWRMMGHAVANRFQLKGNPLRCSECLYRKDCPERPHRG